MNKKITYFLIVFLFTSSVALSQVLEEEQQEPIEYGGEILDTLQSFDRSTDYSAEVNLRGMAGTGDQLPFWMWHNRRGRVSENSNFSGWITGKAITYLSLNSFIEVGAGLLYQDGTNEEVVPDELYAHFENNWLQVTVGRKQRQAKYYGISASNENILWSVNARPLPGIQLSTTKPVFLSGSKGLGFEASWHEFLLGKDRHMEDARLHHKSFHLLYRTKNDFQVKVGFLHFAHWRGTNPEGEEPELTRNYLDAVLLKHPSQNHLSSYEINLSKKFNDFRIELLYNHIATDQSGRRFGNTPDGRYGIFYETLDEDRLINTFIYEFFYTQHQSYDRSGFVDNYFNHFVYKSGWAYKNHILGTPFFGYNTETQQVINNKFTAHHIGLCGQYSTFFRTFPYELMISYSRSDGTYDLRFRPEQNMLATFLDVKILESFIDLNVHFATEFNTYSSPIYGGALHLKYEL